MSADVAASVSKRATGRHLRTALLALLALAALVLSVLAMHSAASSHVMGIPLPVSSLHSAEHDLVAVTSGLSHAQSAGTHHAGMAHAPSADTAQADVAATHPVGMATIAMNMTATTLTMAASHEGMLDCARLVMGCVMLLVIAALILSRRPALVQRFAATGRRVVPRILAVEAPSHRPSLTALCISRV